jgi:rhomboid family GlyGly-CTERM serine protease
MSPARHALERGGPLRRVIRTLIVWIVALLALQVGAPESTLALRYDRAAIVDGAVWRLLTGQLVHLSWAHCLLNAGGLLVCAALFPDRFARRWFWVEALVIAVGVGLGLLWLDPQLAYYAGLSGVIYGVLIRGALPSAGRDWRMAIVLLLVVGRLAWQLWVGPDAAEETMIGGNIIVHAHVCGAVMGMVLSCCPQALRR